MNKTRILSRARLIVENTASSLAVPVFSMLASWLVIRLASAELWGGFTRYYLWFVLAAQVMTFGSKDFLLRAFSARPGKIAGEWTAAFSTRVLLLIPLLLLLGFIPLPYSEKIILGTWLFFRFVYTSFDALVAYQKKFSATLLLECSGFLLFLLGVLFQRERLELSTLFLFFLLAEGLKAGGMVWIFRKEIAVPGRSSFTTLYFRDAWPFFLLSLTGHLGSRADSYCVSIFLEKQEVARYSVLLNFLIYLQASSNFIVLPFLRSIYRLRGKALKKVSSRLLIPGALVSLFGVPASLLVCHYFFKMDYSWSIGLTGIVYVFPVYFMLPRIYFLFRIHKEKWVLMANTLSILLNISLNYLWLPVLGAEGALLAATVAQLSMLLFYHFTERYFLHHGHAELS